MSVLRIIRGLWKGFSCLEFLLFCCWFWTSDEPFFTFFLESAYELLLSFSVKTQRNFLNHSLQTPSSLYRSLQRQVSFRLLSVTVPCNCILCLRILWHLELLVRSGTKLVVHVLRAALRGSCSLGLSTFTGKFRGLLDQAAESREKGKCSVRLSPRKLLTAREPIPYNGVLLSFTVVGSEKNCLVVWKNEDRKWRPGFS